jgi:hypothetical protein
MAADIEAQKRVGNQEAKQPERELSQLAVHRRARQLV